MKNLILILLLAPISICFSQGIKFPKEKENNTTYKGFINQKESLLKKEITTIGNFKGNDLQVIKLTNLDDDSQITVFAFMTENETFNRISKRTRVLEQTEFTKLLNALTKMSALDANNTEEAKYRYLTKNKLEFGSNSSQETHKPPFYMIISAPNIIHFDKKEMNEFLKLLHKAESKL